MDVNGMGADGAATPSEPSLSNDLGNMLSGDLASPSNPLRSEEQAGLAGGDEQAFKFAGRQYPNQAAAEKAWKQLYGKYSDSQGIINTVKKALNNPELLEQLAQDEGWAEILGKLGIETDLGESGNDADEDAEGGRGQDPVSSEIREFRIEREEYKLERGMDRLEKTLGRDLNAAEKRDVLTLISQAPTLTIEQAWKLSQHDRLLKEARSAQGAVVRPEGAPKSNRPAPPPVRTPGSPASARKPVSQMRGGEWKENLRNDPDFKELMSRRG